MTNFWPKSTYKNNPINVIEGLYDKRVTSQALFLGGKLPSNCFKSNKNNQNCPFLVSASH